MEIEIIGMLIFYIIRMVFMNKQKIITMTEYQKKMKKIIKKHLSIKDTFIMMIEEASKYQIKEEK